VLLWGEICFVPDTGTVPTGLILTVAALVVRQLKFVVSPLFIVALAARKEAIVGLKFAVVKVVEGLTKVAAAGGFAVVVVDPPAGDLVFVVAVSPVPVLSFVEVEGVKGVIVIPELTIVGDWESVDWPNSPGSNMGSGLTIISPP
jgi:hypothetical protein